MRAPSAWRVHALGGLSGLLYFLAFPPFGLGLLGGVALAPLVLAVRKAPRQRDAVIAGAMAALVVCMGGYFWIADTAHRFWQAPWVLAVLLLAVYGTFAEIHFTVFAVVMWRLERRSRRTLPGAILALVFTACEMFVPRIFPDKLGSSQIDAGSLSYAAAWVGSHGLSFLLAWLAATLAAVLGARRAAEGARRRTLAELGAWALVLAVACLAGARQRAALDRVPGERVFELALVQSNVGDPEELAASLGSVTRAIDSTVAVYAGLTRQSLAAAPADLVVWPETAVPSVPRTRVIEQLEEVVAVTQTPLLFGAYDAERSPEGRYRFFNSAFLMLPSGEIAGRYAKHKLLVFGEYIPLSNRFPWLLDLLPTPGEFTPGPGPRFFRVGGTMFTPLICYELLFPRVVRRALRGGGEVIVNLTNDYWFGRHLEPHQHLALARMCALETGRPIVRATNTGISAVIDHRGRVVAASGVWTQEVLRHRLVVPPMAWSPFVRWGEWLTAAFVLGSCALALGTVTLAGGRTGPREPTVPKPRPEPVEVRP